MRGQHAPMYYNPGSRRSRRQLQFSERKLLIAFGDVAAVLAAVLIALKVWSLVAQRPFTLELVLSQALWFPLLAGLWVLLARANDFYDLRVASSRMRTLNRLLIIESQLVVLYMIVFFISPRDALPRLFILYYGIASFALIGMWRYARPALLGWVSHPRPTLVVGADWAAQSVVEAMREYASGEYDVHGVIAESAQVGSMLAGVPVLGSGEDLMNFVLRDQISEIVVSSASGLNGALFQGVIEAYERGVRIVPMTLLYEEITGRVPVEHVNDDWAVVFLPQSVEGRFDFYPLIKRGMDFTLALAGLALFALLLPPLALAIRLNSRGPIFYRQERLGKNGTVFPIYKLRSMIPDAEAATGAVFAQKGDPRVTRVGRVLRRTRLDEVPQLLNVLRGDMSLVGPRPERPEHVARLTEKIPFYRTRLIVRPGLTGWAQVNYGYGSNDEDALVKLQYDLYYVRHVSFLLDINILLRTVGKVISMSGV